MRIKKIHNKGYTLVELLTVILILVIVSSVVTGMIFSVLQGSTKSKVSTTLSQNGNYVLSVITNIVIASQRVVAIDTSGDGTLTPIEDCTGSVDPVTGETVYPSGTAIVLERSDGDSTILAFNPSGSPTNISSASASLASVGVDNSVQLLDSSEVKIDTSPGKKYMFMCKQTSPYALPLIVVRFSLVPESITSGRSSTLSQLFTSQILMQNFQNN